MRKIINMTAGINDQEIPLDGILSEFREALLAEIDAARRQGVFFHSDP